MPDSKSKNHGSPIGVLIVAILIIAVVVGVMNPLLTILSVKHVDENLFTMTYYGNYTYIPRGKGPLLGLYRLLVGDYYSPAEQAQLNSTAFTVQGQDGETLVGRNHEDSNSGPILFLLTQPRNDYSSVSIVNLNYLGYQEKGDLGFFKRLPLLLAPTLPFDGMNEHGLVVGVSSVKGSELPFDRKKSTVTGFYAARLMLRKARNLTEALDILRKYNVEFAPWPQLHYLIADASGNSAVVEYIDGQMIIIPSDRPYQVMSDFYLAKKPEKNSEERFLLLNQVLQSRAGQVDEGEVFDLLEGTAQVDNTRWSVVYNTATREVSLVINNDFSEVQRLQVVRK